VKRALVKFAIIVAGWTLLAVLLAGCTAIYNKTVGAPLDFLSTLRVASLDYGIWAVLTPIIFFLAKRFPFKRESWGRTTAIHFVFYLMLTLAHEILGQLVGLPAYVPASFHGSVLWLRLIGALYNDLWMYVPAVVVWSLLEYYRRYREGDMRAAQLKEQLTRAELQALRNQLHPHFLFNTLNSVASLMHEDVDAADDMLGDLSHLLRAYLTDTDAQEIRLRQEIVLLDTYIRIQKRRFEDRLTSALDVPEDLLDAVVPALLLQPLVENSIIHGIAPRSRPGQVRVTARRSDTSLLLEISDDGLGLPEHHAERIGLSNTRSRLRQLYGDACSFEMTNGLSGGVVIKISIPLRFQRTEGDIHSNGDTNGGRGRRTAGTSADTVIAEGR
jgi:two-component sensor histidine kinase